MALSSPTIEPAMVLHQTSTECLGEHTPVAVRAIDLDTGLGAMLSKHLLTGPNRWAIISRAPQGIHYYTDPKSRKNAMRDMTFPRNLNRLERTGLLYGPIAYLASRLNTPQ